MAAGPSPLPVAAAAVDDWQDTPAPATQRSAPAPMDWVDLKTTPGTQASSPTNQLIPPPSLPARFPQMMRDAALEYAPTIGATIGTALVPEAGIPLRMVMAALGGAGGSTAQQVIEKGVGMPGAPQSGPEFLKRAGTDAAVQAGGEFGGQIINKTLGNIFKRFTPTQLYQSALQPPPSKGTAEIGRMVNQGLESKIPVSAEGQEAAHQMWQDLNKQIESQIAADPNKPIDPKMITSTLNGLRQKWFAGSGDPAYLAAIDKVEQNFLMRHDSKVQPFTSGAAQQAKKTIYNEIRLAKEGAWGSHNPQPLDVQAKIELAGSLKQELENLYPGIKGLNAKEGAAIGLDRALDRLVSKEGNKRISPYFAMLGAMSSLGGGFASGHMEAGIGGAVTMLGGHILRSALEDPEIKSKLAIAMAQAGKSRVIKVGKLVAPYLAPTAARGAGQTVQGVLQAPPE